LGCIWGDFFSSSSGHPLTMVSLLEMANKATYLGEHLQKKMKNQRKLCFGSGPWQTF
jgi:hypothetical protein